jgi:hypothetical protein
MAAAAASASAAAAVAAVSAGASPGAVQEAPAVAQAGESSARLLPRRSYLRGRHPHPPRADPPGPRQTTPVPSLAAAPVEPGSVAHSRTRDRPLALPSSRVHPCRPPRPVLCATAPRATPGSTRATCKARPAQSAPAVPASTFPGFQPPATRDRVRPPAPQLLQTCPISARTLVLVLTDGLLTQRFRPIDSLLEQVHMQCGAFAPIEIAEAVRTKYTTLHQKEEKKKKTSIM